MHQWIGFTFKFIWKIKRWMSNGLPQRFQIWVPNQAPDSIAGQYGFHVHVDLN